MKYVPTFKPTYKPVALAVMALAIMQSAAAQTAPADTAAPEAKPAAETAQTRSGCRVRFAY